MGTWGQEAGALMVTIEHRYYGKSIPFGGDIYNNTERLLWLSSKQQLGDLAYFHDYIQAKYNISRSPWIVFGGSYPGALSAWYRMKYPYMVAGSVAEAAPANATNSSPLWNRFIANTAGPTCTAHFVSVFQLVQSMAYSPQGWQQLQQLFPDLLTFPTEFGGFQSPQSFLVSLQQLVGGLAEFDYAIPFAYPYAYPMSHVCQQMAQTKTPQEELQVLSELAAASVGWLTKIGVPNLSFYAFTWQRCTELAIWADYDPISGLFNNVTDFTEFLVPWCQQTYGKGVYPNLEGETNRFYGGPDRFGLSAGNIAFVADLLDPTHAFQPLVPLSSSVTAFNIPNVAHGALLNPIVYPISPQPLVQARSQIQSLISSWVQSYQPPPSSLEDLLV